MANNESNPMKFSDLNKYIITCVCVFIFGTIVWNMPKAYIPTSYKYIRAEQNQNNYYMSQCPDVLSVKISLSVHITYHHPQWTCYWRLLWQFVFVLQSCIRRDDFSHIKFISNDVAIYPASIFASLPTFARSHTQHHVAAFARPFIRIESLRSYTFVLIMRKIISKNKFVRLRTNI